MKSPLSWLVLGTIKAYRKYISGLSQPKCKFYPTCSTYGLEAVSTHGAIKGLILSTYRLCRCHPWSMGGIDYVPLKGQWKPAPHYSMNAQELSDYWKALDSADEEQQLIIIEQQLARNSDRAHKQRTHLPSGRN
ncbi:MAG: membrane protein insertion efficiency factor YidD [Actinomycetaceae bacterium]|nr:membrane protein insertion efficiency factor YidD [Actinomycetaceae bacterium]